MIHRLTKAMYTVHRVLGTLWCLVFLCWFLSAFVMLYHRFPRVSDKDILAKQELLCSSEQEAEALPSIAELMAEMPEIKSGTLALNRQLGQTKLQVSTRKGKKEIIVARHGHQVESDSLLQLAALWCNAPIIRKDTLTRLDRWLPFEELKAELPIYKYSFGDAEQTTLYIGSQSGKVVQHTTRSERFWAYLGAIPHWAYLVELRQDQQLWERFMITLTAVGCLMLLSGGWVTVDVWRKSRNKKGLRSPYRKRWYHWHYVSGIVFGFFMLTFTFSGMVYEVGIPQWVHRSAFTQSPLRLLKSGKPTLSDYVLDYRTVLRAYPKAKRLEWSSFRNHPYYTVTESKHTYYIDATDTVPRPLFLTEEEVLQGVASVYQSDSAFIHARPAVQIEQCEQFETYYRNISHQPQPQLPVYKVKVDDTEGSVFYIQPQTGVVRYVDTVARIKYWSYTALHRFRLPGLNSNGTLRKTILFIVLMGGTVVCVTGVVLSINYLRRKTKRKNLRKTT